MDDIINDIIIKCLIEAGCKHPVLDCLREVDEFLEAIANAV